MYHSDKFHFSTDTVLEILGVYAIRSYEGPSTILCFIPSTGPQSKPFIDALYRWFENASKDHYRQLFEEVRDPTFAVLPILWFVIYVWADAIEILYELLDKLVSAPPLFFL